MCYVLQNSHCDWFVMLSVWGCLWRRDRNCSQDIGLCGSTSTGVTMAPCKLPCPIQSAAFKPLNSLWPGYLQDRLRSAGEAARLMHIRRRADSPSPLRPAKLHHSWYSGGMLRQSSLGGLLMGVNDFKVCLVCFIGFIFLLVLYSVLYLYFILLSAA